MIIVSQNKKSFYNFDNVKSVDVLDNEIYITDDILSDKGTRIGEYATEERAKEVLKEIVQCYANTEQYKCLANIVDAECLNDLAENTFVYAMPENKKTKEE